MLFYKIIFTYVKVSKNSSAKYYIDTVKKKDYKKELVKDIYRRYLVESLSIEEEEEKKQQYGHGWYKNLSEHKKRLVEYRKIYQEMKKKRLTIISIKHKNSLIFVWKIWFFQTSIGIYSWGYASKVGLERWASKYNKLFYFVLGFGKFTR